MPEKERTMKCPFQQRKTGEFFDCYGKDCMAYLEYETLQFDSQCSTSRGKQVKTSVCKRIMQVPQYVGL